MRSICLALSVLVCASWANEDVLIDYISNVIHGEKFQRRAVISAVSGSSVISAAKAFAGSIGSRNSLARGVSKSFEDSCLGSSGGNPIKFPNFGRPGVTINPLIWKKIFGKRAEEALFIPITTFPRFTRRPFFPTLTRPSFTRPPFFPTIDWRKKLFGKRAEEAKLANRDIVFVLDSSGSIPQDQFEKAKQAISTLVASFCPSKLGNAVTDAGAKQISVVVFDSTVTTEVDFSESAKGLGFLQDKIMSIKHRRGSTATGDAMTYIKNKVLGKGSSRLNNPKVSTDVIVITDGQCNKNCRVLGSEANAIRKMGHGVNLFAMGVANARACELEIITGQGGNLAYGLGDFRNFDRFATAVKEIAQENASKCA